MNDSLNDYFDDFQKTKVIDSIYKPTGSYVEIEGDLISLAKEGKFDAITHGCNISCVMGAGIAPQLAKAFGCNMFDLEADQYRNDINKLGQIDYEWVNPFNGERDLYNDPNTQEYSLAMINSYTQTLGTIGGRDIPLDYEALTLCLRKINYIFEGKRVGLPLIGGGLAMGDKNKIISIIKSELRDCHVTLVLFTKNK